METGSEARDTWPKSRAVVDPSNTVSRQPPYEQEVHILLLCVASRIVSTLSGCHYRCEEAANSFLLLKTNTDDTVNLLHISTRYRHQQSLVLCQRHCLAQQFSGLVEALKPMVLDLGVLPPNDFQETANTMVCIQRIRMKSFFKPGEYSLHVLVSWKLLTWSTLPPCHMQLPCATSREDSHCVIHQDRLPWERTNVMQPKWVCTVRRLPCQKGKPVPAASIVGHF